MKNNIFSRIKEIIMNTFDGVSEDEISPDLVLFTGGLEIASLETVLLYLAIEEEFSIELPEDAYININKISDLIKCVEDCLS